MHSGCTPTIDPFELLETIMQYTKSCHPRRPQNCTDYHISSLIPADLLLDLHNNTKEARNFNLIKHFANEAL